MIWRGLNLPLGDCSPRYIVFSAQFTNMKRVHCKLKLHRNIKKLRITSAAPPTNENNPTRFDLPHSNTLRQVTRQTNDYGRAKLKTKTTKRSANPALPPLHHRKKQPTPQLPRTTNQTKRNSALLCLNWLTIRCGRKAFAHPTRPTRSKVHS